MQRGNLFRISQRELISSPPEEADQRPGMARPRPRPGQFRSRRPRRGIRADSPQSGASSPRQARDQTPEAMWQALKQTSETHRPQPHLRQGIAAPPPQNRRTEPTPDRHGKPPLRRRTLIRRAPSTDTPADMPRCAPLCDLETPEPAAGGPGNPETRDRASPGSGRTEPPANRHQSAASNSSPRPLSRN